MTLYPSTLQSMLPSKHDETATESEAAAGPLFVTEGVRQKLSLQWPSKDTNEEKNVLLSMILQANLI